MGCVTQSFSAKFSGRREVCSLSILSGALELRRGLRSFRVPWVGVAELAGALDSKSIIILGSDRLIAALLTLFQWPGLLYRIALESHLIAKTANGCGHDVIDDSCTHATGIRPLAPAGAVAELHRYVDGELFQKLFRIFDGRCFSCVPDATSVKSGNPAQQARGSNRAVSRSVVAIRCRFFWPSPASKSR